MHQAERGFSAILIIILVTMLAGIPAYYMFYSNRLSSDVKGASSTKTISTPGFGVTVKAKSASWDFVEYLCTSYDECVSSVNSGRRLGTVSGGSTDSHDIVVKYSDDWEDYTYIKYFVRSGLYAESSTFTVENLGDVPNSEIHTITENGVEYTFVLTPLEEVSSTFIHSAVFTDSN